MATVIEKPTAPKRPAKKIDNRSNKDLEQQNPNPESHNPPPSLTHRIVMTTAVVAPFLGFVAAIVLAWQFGLMSWFYLGMLVGGWMITGLGITVGFHRLLTHRSFDTYPWVRTFFAAIGSLALEGAPTVWCAVHRKHHRFSDEDGDPHSPHLHDGGIINILKGFVHAHVGWVFGKVWTDQSLEKFVPDLLEERGIRVVSKHYVWSVIASLVIPAVIGAVATLSFNPAVWGLGALLGFLWGGLARVFVTHHITWSINSICHIFGSKDYKAGDDSRNNLIFGILGHGEGWHNNHHAFPTSARHGLKWWQFDTSWIVIRTMQLVGLAWNVRTPSQKALEGKKLS